MSLRQRANRNLPTPRFRASLASPRRSAAVAVATLIFSSILAAPLLAGDPQDARAGGGSASSALALATQERAATALAVKATDARTFYLDQRAGNSQVTFFSQSTLEDFTGVCNRVAGECRVNPRRLEDFAGSFSIKVEDIKTGIELRDSHMRGPDWLDAANHPEVSVTVKSCENVKRSAENVASMDLVAACLIRGVHKDIRIPASLTYLDESPTTMKRVKGDLIRIRAEFGVKLSDFGIKGPIGADTIGLKVADDIQIKVTVFGSTENPPEALTPDKAAATSMSAKLDPPKRP